MGSVRGLRTRLCPKCGELTPHRTLYVKTNTGGRSKWFQLFWACTMCGSLNHIVLPIYRLERVSFHLPSVLAIAVVNALEEGQLDLDELIVNLRKRQIPGSITSSTPRSEWPSSFSRAAGWSKRCREIVPRRCSTP